MKNTFIFIRRMAYWSLAQIDKLLGRENSAVILVFHAIDESSWFFSNSQAQIEAYLKLLAKHYKFISLSEMLDVVQKKKHHPEKVLALTFDDGYHSILSIAPLLKELGIKPTVFALSDPQNVNRQELETQHELLTESELLVLNKMFGWEIGSHSATHEDLTKLSHKQLPKQISDSRKKLSKLIDSEIQYFAYPKGTHGTEVIEHVQKAGYKAAFTMDHHEITLLGDIYRVPRIGINHTYSIQECLSSISPSVIFFRNKISKITSLFNK